MAQMAGMSTLDVLPIKTCAPMMGQKDGKTAITRAPSASAATAIPTGARSPRTRSTSPPAGVCARIPATGPTMSATPTLS
jgi:hypothetical protein